MYGMGDWRGVTYGIKNTINLLKLTFDIFLGSALHFSSSGGSCCAPREPRGSAGLSSRIVAASSGWRAAVGLGLTIVESSDLTIAVSSDLEFAGSLN